MGIKFWRNWAWRWIPKWLDWMLQLAILNRVFRRAPHCQIFRLGSMTCKKKSISLLERYGSGGHQLPLSHQQLWIWMFSLSVVYLGCLLIVVTIIIKRFN